MLGCGLSWPLAWGEPWTSNGGILQGSLRHDVHCGLVRTLVTWTSRRTAQLHAHNLQCVSSDPVQPLRAARFITGYVRLDKSPLLPSV